MGVEWQPKLISTVQPNAIHQHRRHIKADIGQLSVSVRLFRMCVSSSTAQRRVARPRPAVYATRGKWRYRAHSAEKQSVASPESAVPTLRQLRAATRGSLNCLVIVLNCA